LPFTHTPVMMAEVLHSLAPRPGGIYVDGTLGGAGHARAVLERIGPGGLLIGIDQDPDAIRNGRRVLKDGPTEVRLFQDNFVALPRILSELGIPAVDGILLDLGLSFHQIRESGRGFSFQHDEPLDMRMDPADETSAWEIVNRESAAELARIFKVYGEERHARRIARRIVETRRQATIDTTGQLADRVRDAVPGGHRPDSRIHPATRVFMALRIRVNRELERIGTFMAQVAENDGAVLRNGGRLCILAFHSLEDRIVKHALKSMAADCACPPGFPQCVCGQKPFMRILTRKPLRPGPDETAANPMARSTRLRAAEKR
jgi:16S rRNA (cytosine1402-N4)-methyltransferase